MFRYLAVISNDAALEPNRWMARVDVSDQFTATWQPAVQIKGLSVFTTRTSGAFTAYPLPDGHGAVLGRLFKPTSDAASRRLTALPMQDALDIAATAGDSLVASSWGSYVAFIRDRHGQVAVLRDPGGALPCYFLRFDAITVVFSWLEDVLTFLPGIPAPSVSSDGLAAHIAFGELCGVETALDGVLQVRPGERVVFQGERHGGSFAWNLLDHATRRNRAPGADPSAELRDVVLNCTTAWASCYSDLILRLSGGVDSSILASCLRSANTTARVTCLNYHSPGADGDERGYARLAAARAGLTLIEKERDASFDLARVFDVARTPAPTNYLGKMSSAAMDAALACSMGVPALFTGAGGDQLFFEFRQWWPAADYLRERGVSAGFFRASLDAARLSRLSFWSVLRLAFADRFRGALPIPEVHSHWTLATSSVRDIAAQQDRFVHPAVLAAGSLGIGKLHQVWNLAHSNGFYDPHLREAAPELIHPLLSQPIIEFCLRTPSHILAEGGRGRGLVRRTFAANLPREIATRRTKGGIDDHVGEVLARNAKFARETLLDGELVRRGLLDRHRVEQALQGNAATLLGRAGEIHFFIGIEAWLRRWANSPRCAGT